MATGSSHSAACAGSSPCGARPGSGERTRAGVFLPANRFILGRTWDRTQLPRPFSTLTGRFRAPIDPRDFDDPASLHARAAAELLALEQAFDPDEARHAGREPASVGATRERSR